MRYQKISTTYLTKIKKNRSFFFPVFISQGEGVASKSLSPGQMLQVNITNNNGGGVYVNYVTETNSVINIYNENEVSSGDLFRCSVIRFSRVVNNQSGGVSSGEVITAEKNNLLTR